MSFLNKIFAAGSNVALKVTNLFGTGVQTVATDTLSGLPLGTADGTVTGELGVKVIFLGGSIVLTPEVLTVYRDQTVNSTKESVLPTTGKLLQLYCINLNTYPVYLKFYDLALGSVTVGTTVPVLTLAVPANGYLILEYNGFPYKIFSTAIVVAAVKNANDSDATALTSDIQLQLGLGA